MMHDKLGYYTCQGIRFESKMQAMLYANPRNVDIQWHFNDSAYNSYTWDQEPQLSLDALYDARARQIREQYDYVILSYSGGSDSNNILEAFLRQGLFIDEIVTNWALDLTGKYLDTSGKDNDTWNNNSEFYLHTRHRLNYIKNVSPNTKITINDTSEALINAIRVNEDSDWITKKNDAVNVTGITTYNISYFMRHTLDMNRRIAYLIGTDKPKLRVVGDDLFMFFIDKAVNMIALDEITLKYPNVTPVFFYWDPDAVDIVCKQGHVVLNYIKNNPHVKPLWASLDVMTQRRYQEEVLKWLIYPTTWKDGYWQVRKSTKDWDSELDYWFTRGMKDTREYAAWFAGLREVAPKINRFLILEDGMIRGSRPYFSKFFRIGSVTQEV